MTTPEAGASYASVAVPVPVRRLFTYRVEAALATVLAVGCRVRVPFGNRKQEGTVVEWPTAAPDAAIDPKPIEAVVRGIAPLPPAILELARFVSDYYLCSWGEAIDAAMPPTRGVLIRRRYVRRLPAAQPEQLSSRAVARRNLLEKLPADGERVEWSRLDESERRAASALERLGWVERIEEQEAPATEPGETNGSPAAERPPTPTPGQAAVLERIESRIAQGGYHPCLLFGATGSGKTEVYMRAARATLDRGRSVLWLVPEIGLTPLLRSKISRRFPGQVAVLHSGLPRRERYAGWERARTGRARLVVGTRSAVFAPLDEIGLIVVDEEQDGSYKQEETPRYNGRDLAVVRARESGAVILLGSATPSMESFHHARSGRYELLRLGGRIGRRPLAEVSVVDMRDEYRDHGEVTPLSAPLRDALQECLARGDQALVLRNRRGWAVALHCPRCGERVGCSRCSISLTWHRSERRLRCHFCDETQRYPPCCPTCGHEEMNLIGEGTERLEELLRESLPDARIERMDRDTIRGRGAHEALLRRFDVGEIDVLVGTQMIAKGHDFPRVTLVGVVSADQSLGLPDFRAGERAFQLLTQVAGRAGRGERPGRVVVQAFDPDHPVLRLAAKQDFEEFFEREMRYRRALRYPPLSAMVQIVISDRELHRAREWGEVMAQALREAGGGRLVLSGPGPAPIERRAGRYRQQILARTSGRRRLVEATDRALAAVEGKLPRRAILVDVDPLSLL